MARSSRDPQDGAPRHERDAQAPVANLRGNGDNPYSAGSPPVDASQPSAYPQGGPPAYYVPLPDPAAGNPWSQGSAGSAAAGMAAGLDALYNDLLHNRQQPTTDSGKPADVLNDEGFGRSGNGRS